MIDSHDPPAPEERPPWWRSVGPARIGVLGGASPCTLIARRFNRPAAAVIGIQLCLVCLAFQFSNNRSQPMLLPDAAPRAIGLLPPDPRPPWEGA